MSVAIQKVEVNIIKSEGKDAEKPGILVKVRRSKSDKNPFEVRYNFGADLEEAQKLFDGDSKLDAVVYNLFLTAAKRQLSDYVQGLMVPGTDKDGKERKALTPSQIHAAVATWKPTVQKKAKQKVNKAEAMIAAMSPEERQALFARLGGGAPVAASEDDDED